MNTQSIYNHFRKLTIGAKSSGNSSANNNINNNNNNIECENTIVGKGKNFCQAEKDKKKKKKDKKESCQMTFDEINNCNKTDKFEFELNSELSQQVKRGQQKQLEAQQQHQHQQQQHQQHHQYQPQHRQQHKLLDSQKGVNATASYSIQANSNKYYDDEDQEIIDEEEEGEDEENNDMNSTFDNKQHCDVAIGDYKSALRNQQLVAGRLFANKNKELHQQQQQQQQYHHQLPYLYHTNAQMLAMSSSDHNIQTNFSQINQSSANNHHQVNFGFHQTVKYDDDDEPEQSERKKKYLTAKYGSHQMSLIKKRLRVEMMLHEELQKLAEVIFKNYNNNNNHHRQLTNDNNKNEDDNHQIKQHKTSQLAEHQSKLIDDIEIDIDSLLDMDDEIERIKSIKHTLSPLLMDKQSIKLINEFANTILEQIRLL